jgi:glycosyltransferase involved in cell wall biosynthesis
LIGYVDDEDVPALYSGAEWFVYTSQYEGFGLPPLEAMSCSCPVITSNSSSLPEVVGDAGVMIDYDSDEQHIRAYENYYFNPQLRAEYSEKGLARAKLFSWKKCTDLMVDTMKKSLRS